MYYLTSTLLDFSIILGIEVGQTNRNEAEKPLRGWQLLCFSKGDHRNYSQQLRVWKERIIFPAK